MNKIILAAVLGATTFVSACESAEVKAERLAAEQAALSVCPAEEVVGITASFQQAKNLTVHLIAVSPQSFRLTALSLVGQKALAL